VACEVGSAKSLYSKSWTAAAGFVTVHRVHRVLEKSLKVLEFGEKNSRPLKVLENRVGP